MHIRRTDQFNSIKYSPIELFEEKIDDVLSKKTDVVFYLSTDDPTVENRLKAKYQDKIFVRKKEFNRNTITGIQDAVVDMFCLSKTSVIYGSFASSFSEIAARIGNIDCIFVKNDE